MPICCSFFRLCSDDRVQVDAVTRCGRDVGVLEAGRGQSRRKTRASWRQDAGVLEAGRGRLGGRTRASWRQDAGALEVGRGQCGRKTRAEWTRNAGRRGGKLFLGSTVPYKSHIMPFQILGIRPKLIHPIKDLEHSCL